MSKEEKLKNVSQQFESLFLSQILKEMRGTVASNDLLGENSMASKIFREMWDNAVSQSAAETSSFGLADMVYEQLASAYLTRTDGSSSSDENGQQKFDMLLKNFSSLKNVPKVLDEFTTQGLNTTI